MKKICTGISPDFVKKWTVEEAVREILQNYLDSRKEFGCNGKISQADGVATVRDYGPGLQLKHLALGVSEKSDDCIGRFGKGLKQALLVLARQGRAVTIFSNGLRIKPTVEYSEDYNTEMMHLVVEEATGQTANIKGCWINFECSSRELEDAKQYFLHFLKGEIIKLDEKLMLPGGKVFVNGSCVGTVDNALFSYNLNHTEAEAAMSSDRDMVNKDALHRITRQILGETESYEAMGIVLRALKQKERYFELYAGLNCYTGNKKSHKKWAKKFTQVFGDNSVVQDDRFDREAQYRGYNVVELDYEWRGNFHTFGIPNSTDVVTAESADISSLLVKKLTEEQKTILGKAVEAVANYYSDPGEVQVAYELNSMLGVPQGQGTVRGIYCPETNKIYVALATLESEQSAIQTILHETVHMKTGCSDVTAEFEDALCRAGAQILAHLM